MYIRIRCPLVIDNVVQRKRWQSDLSKLLVTSAAKARKLLIRENEAIKNVYCNWCTVRLNGVLRVRPGVHFTAVTLIRPAASVSERAFVMFRALNR